MNNRSCLLIDLLRNPERLNSLKLSDWNILVRQASHSLLLGRLHLLMSDNNLLEEVPKQPLNHTYSAFLASEKQKSTVQWEVSRIHAALESLKLPVILLKGAAYIIADHEIASGRLLSDIDILVPKESIDEVEQALYSWGWHSTKMEPYDQHYFREWMHEIPPLRHIVRNTWIDVHHTILPPTAKYKPDAEKIIAAAIEVKPGVCTLSPEDMVIHSATHLFHEGELEHGLRDMVDIDGLLTQFGEHEPVFWDRLVDRSIELDLVRPLYYGLHYAVKILNTDVPERVLNQAQTGAPNPLMIRVMDWLFIRALRPNHPSCDLPFSSMARFLLYIRSHYLRMPLYLLIPHLVRKAWKTRFEDTKPEMPAINQDDERARQ